MYSEGRSQGQSHPLPAHKKGETPGSYQWLLDSFRAYFFGVETDPVSMTSIDTYTTFNVTVPAALSGALWALTFFPLLFALLCVDQIPRFFIELLQLSMSDIEKDKSCVEIDGCKIKKKYLKFLVLLVIPLTLATVFFSFWNVWLVEEEPRGGCIPNFDCFPILDGRMLQDTPVEDCFFNTSLLPELNTADLVSNNTEIGEQGVGLDGAITYKCYRFVFNYAQGIGAAGGILFFTVILSKLYISIFVTLFNINSGGALIGLIILWISMPLLWLSFIVVNTATPMIRETVFQTTSNTIQFVLYAANFLAVVVIGGYVVSIGIYKAD